MTVENSSLGGVWTLGRRDARESSGQAGSLRAAGDAAKSRRRPLGVPWSSSSRILEFSSFAGSSGEVGGAGGQGKSELGAAAGRLPHHDAAAVRLDQALDDVEPEAGAAAPLALAAPKPPEDELGGLGRDALALVAYHYDGPFSVEVRLYRN